MYALTAAPNPWSLAPGGGESVQELLAEARALLEDLEDQVHRLSAEVWELRAGGTVLGVLVWGPLGYLIEVPGGIEERASSYEGLIEQIERFVMGTFSRIEKKAMAGDLDAARRLVDVTGKIAGVARTTSPVEELKDDVRELMDGLLEDLEDVSKKIAMLTGAIAVLAGVVLLTR